VATDRGATAGFGARAERRFFSLRDP
jgi:hypothetical protein